MLDTWPVGGIQDEATIRTFLGPWADTCGAAATAVEEN